MLKGRKTQISKQTRETDRQTDRQKRDRDRETERERDRERQRDREKERERQRQRVMVCHATAQDSIPGGNSTFIELHVLRKGQ